MSNAEGVTYRRSRGTGKGRDPGRCRAKYKEHILKYSGNELRGAASRLCAGANARPLQWCKSCNIVRFY
ncbi:hypothetical protein GDO81_012837 [Engystomops pustulosus]|uniref:Uncharacterized protein n=1 Tax=Engystomops pustulosus TaxID=76066 RepID=A0AAV7AZW1_ENGPU|nr:hypothetical protein GDO81_012837 [Engystomops pustulosus]